MSYFQVLGLDREPFSTSPDPLFFYQSQRHRATLANLVIEFRLKRGLSVVIGDVGVGKTTLGRKLIQMLSEREGFIFHMMLDPTFPSEEQFYQALIRSFGIETAAVRPTLLDYREGLERFLFRKGVEEHKTVVLIIDEAHKLNPLSLEALRVLLNYETNETKLLQLVLLGQMELLPLLKSMPNVVDRISMKSMLTPLTFEETREMVEFRLYEAGYHFPSPLFLDEAIHAIYRASSGYPRKIAMLCHRALRGLVMYNRSVVDRELVDNVLQEDIEAGWSPTEALQKSVC
ncbi:MAG: AAA family ATPase [Candidatus Omnitrophica bacterium]|nr:AAA family ATPase [Candidatus Omnitrophota bacterium]